LGGEGKDEKRNTRSEERRQDCLNSKLRSFGPGRVGPQDDRAVNSRDWKSGGPSKLPSGLRASRVNKAPHSKKKPQA
jgi:hypothetical protein